MGILGEGASPDEALGSQQFATSLVVALPDATRPLALAPVLAALAARVAGVLTPVIGLGLHRPMTAAELAPIAGFSPIQSDPDDWVATVDVGGIPGTLSRRLPQGQPLLSVGICELHQYAGLSGGHKGVSVGCAGRPTIAALHARDRVLADGVRLGQVAGNPFRQAVDALGEAAGCRLALCFVPGPGRWILGEPRAVVARAAALLDPWEPVQRDFSGAVLRVPPAKASSLYQASRAATYLGLSPAPPLLPGATLVLDAACPEGLGSEEGFIRALSSEAAPWSGLLSGPEPTGAGAQRAVMLALLARRYRLVLTGCIDPAPLRAVGIAVWPQAPSGPDWLEVPRPFSRLPQRG